MYRPQYYVFKYGTKIWHAQERLTLRNLYIKWNLWYVGIPEDLPDGHWFVTLEERRNVVFPGLVFREA